MSRRLIALAAALLLLAMAGCGGSADAKKNDDQPTASAGSTRSKADKLLDKTRKQIEDAGTGRFGQTISDADGTVVSRLSGTYSLKDEQVRARLTIPNGLAKGKAAVADVLEADGKAWVRTNQFPKSVAGCYLTTTPQELLTSFGVDVAGRGDSVPLALRLLGSFQPASTTGGGVLQGELPLADVVPMLPAGLSSTLLQQEPKGITAASAGISGRQVTVSVAGFSLVGALSAATQQPEATYNSLRSLHFDATLAPATTFEPVTAPPAGQQMTGAQLNAGKCG